jgi:ornithine decarboxylase
MIKPKQLQQLAREHGTPLFVFDHQVLRNNYAMFRKHLPRVQIYYAVKANPDPQIVKTLYQLGSSFDVASMPELQIVYQYIKHLSASKRQHFIWDKIIYANPIKDVRTLKQLDQYKALVTYDNPWEIAKVKKHAPHSGLALRIRVPNTGSVVELSSKFGAGSGEALNLIESAQKVGLVVEGLSFHVGSQCTNYRNYIQALNLAAGVFKEAADHGYKLKLLDIGGGFPAPYERDTHSFAELAKQVNLELDRLFPKDVELLAEPGRFLVATCGMLVAQVIGKAVRDGKICYYIDDGVYHTFSGQIFDHINYHLKAFKHGTGQVSSVFGPTCDALDTISLSEVLPDLELGDLVYSENIGAYSHASSTYFNGFPPAKVVHLNQ